jgi:hypothetical protein
MLQLASARAAIENEQREHALNFEGSLLSPLDIDVALRSTPIHELPEGLFRAAVFFFVLAVTYILIFYTREFSYPTTRKDIGGGHNGTAEDWSLYGDAFPY